VSLDPQASGDHGQVSEHRLVRKHLARLIDWSLVVMVHTRRVACFVLVGGWPASGKTTLARALAVELQLPYVSKDEVKEALGRARGPGLVSGLHRGRHQPVGGCVFAGSGCSGCHRPARVVRHLGVGKRCQVRQFLCIMIR
jgi:hypothetical protein